MADIILGMKKLEVSACHTLLCHGLMGVRQIWWGAFLCQFQLNPVMPSSGEQVSTVSESNTTPSTAVLQIQWHKSYLKGCFVWTDQHKHQEAVLEPIFTASFKPRCIGDGADSTTSVLMTEAFQTLQTGVQGWFSGQCSLWTAESKANAIENAVTTQVSCL